MNPVVHLIARQVTAHVVLSALAYGFGELRLRYLKDVSKVKPAKLHRVNSTDGG